MIINNIKWTFDAWEEYQYWYKTDKTNFKTINNLIKDMKRTLFGGIWKA